MEIRNVQQNSGHVFKVGDGKLRNNHSDLWAVGTWFGVINDLFIKNNTVKKHLRGALWSVRLILAGLSEAKLQPEMMSGCYQLSVLAQAFCFQLR